MSNILSSQIKNRLKSYTAAAGAMLAVGQVAEAQVAYTEVTDQLDVDSISVDFNHDGIIDFEAKVGPFGEVPAGKIKVTTGLVLAGSYYPYFALVKSNGYSINSSVTNLMANATIINDATSTNGNYWSDVANQFMAVKFDIGENSHFGWVKMSCNSSPMKLSLISYAYSINPNSGITCETPTCNFPDSPTMTPTATVCPNQDVTLSVESGELNNADNWKWYTDIECTSLVNTGSTFTVSPTSPLNYYIRGEGANCGGVIGAQTEFFLNIFETPPPIDIGDIINTCSSPYTLDVGQESWNEILWTTGENTQTIDVTASGEYSVICTNYDGCESKDTVQVNIIPLLSATNNINGNPSVCYGSIEENYFITPIPEATLYTWNIPSGATISSGIGTNSIFINWGTATNGVITVTPSNSCGDGPSSSISITVIQPFGTTNAITGDTSICYGHSGDLYSINAIPNASNYTWTVPSGANIVGGNGTNSITVDWGTASSGVIEVTPSNFCGSGTTNSLPITVALPLGTTGAITGDNSFCAGTSGVSYSIPVVTGATNYNWTIPSGAIITSGQNSSSINIDWETSTGGIIRITPSNSCFAGTTRSMSVSIIPNIGNTSAIVGTSSVCINDINQIYSISAVTGATNYNWFIPSGASLVSGQNSTSITIDFSSSINGNIQVTPFNTCFTGTESTLAVTINPLPTVAFSGLNAEYCENSNLTTLAGSPSGGVFTGSGISGNEFFPTNASFGENTIEYSYDDGICSNSYFQIVTINTVSVGDTTAIACNSFNWYGTTYTSSATPTNTFVNAEGCDSVVTLNLTINPLPNISAGNNIDLCNGETTQLVATSTSTAIPLTYTWDNGLGVGQTQTVSPIYTTTYIVSLTDSNACVNTDTVIVNVLDMPVAEFTTTISPQTCGTDDGLISVTDSSIYTYEWSNSSSTTATATNLAGGNHSVTITSNSCSIVLDTILAEPTEILIILDVNEDSICEGTNVQFTANGISSGTYQFLLNGTSIGAPDVSNIYSSNTINNGDYITVIGVDGVCSGRDSIQISVLPVPQPLISGDNINCLAQQGTYLVDGGTNSIYSWSISSGGAVSSGNGTNSIIVNWTSPGTHTISINEDIVDYSGCQASNNFDIIVSSTPPVLVITDPEAVCAPNVIDLTNPNITAGSQDVVYINYLNTTGTQVANPSQIGTSGLYFIEAINGCGTDTMPVNVYINDSAPNIVITNPNTVCVPNTVDLTSPEIIEGSTNVFSFEYWNDATQTSHIVDPTQISVTGDYYISSSNGCGEDMEVVNVTINEVIDATFTGLPTEICSNSGISMLVGIPAGGTFTGAGISGNIFNPINAELGENTIIYSFNNINCINSDNQIVNINSIPQLVLESTTNSSCNQAYGSATISATGGTPTYLYLWNNSSTTETISGVHAGIYSVTVSDAKNCSANLQVSIIDNLAPSVSIINQTNTGCSLSCTGSALAEVGGGAQPYTYLWSSQETVANATHLCAGQNILLVTDNNNCIGSAVVEIGQDESANPIIYGTVSYSGGNVNGDYASLEIYSLNNNQGGGFHNIETANWDIGTDGTFAITNFPPDDYILKAKILNQNEYPTLMNSYFSTTDTTFKWIEATTISLDCDMDINANIIMYEMFDNGTGNGQIEGFVFYPLDELKNTREPGIYTTENKSITSFGEPVPGAEIFLELEPDEQPISNTETDNNGAYGFGNLANGSYKIKVEIPGFVMVSSYDVDVTDSDTLFIDRIFVVDTTAGNSNIDTLNGICNYSNDNFSINVYPNPFKDNLNISYSLKGQSKVSLEIFDIQGKKVDELVNEKQIVGDYKYNFNTKKHGLHSGSYLLKLTVDNITYFKRIVDIE